MEPAVNDAEAVEYGAKVASLASLQTGTKV